VWGKIWGGGEGENKTTKKREKKKGGKQQKKNQYYKYNPCRCTNLGEGGTKKKKVAGATKQGGLGGVGLVLGAGGGKCV